MGTRWLDLTGRQETTTHKRAGGMRSHRGVVVHTASGHYEGTISWQRKDLATMRRLGEDPTSSHFVASKAGDLAQMMDLEDLAWAQGDGNPDWISVECEGFGGVNGETLTDAQMDAVARILAKAHQVYGAPLQVANDPGGWGLGHHSMGGARWGHQFCPGPPIIAQKPAIVARAVALLNPNNHPEDIVDAAAVEDIWQHYIAVEGLNLQDHMVQGGAAAKRAEAAVAQLSSKVDGLVAVLHALAQGDASIDTTVLLARIDQRAAEDVARDQAQLAKIAELEAELAQLRAATKAGAQAEADGLAGTPGV